MKAIPFYLIFLLPASLVFGSILGGINTYAALIILILIIPVCDLLFQDLRKGRRINDNKKISGTLSFRIIPMIFAPVHIAVVVWLGYFIASSDLTTIEVIGLVLSMGLTSGSVGMAVAHELIHKRSSIKKMLGKAALLMACYMHYDIDHQLGHHTYVGTSKDPTSAPQGQSFYTFFIYAVPNVFFSAWRIELARLSMKKQQVWSLHNKMIPYSLLPLLFGITMGLSFGWEATVFFITQGFLAFTILNVVNYVEHYGLRRKEVSPGRYERIRAIHSWESNKYFSNLFFLKFQRHADHHLHPRREYQDLELQEESPKLPTGYAGMTLLALIPPLWKFVMDPLVKQHVQAQID